MSGANTMLRFVRSPCIGVLLRCSPLSAQLPHTLVVSLTSTLRALRNTTPRSAHPQPLALVVASHSSCDGLTWALDTSCSSSATLASESQVSWIVSLARVGQGKVGKSPQAASTPTAKHSRWSKMGRPSSFRFGTIRTNTLKRRL